MGTDTPISVTLSPGDPRAAGWRSSRPTPWGAPQCANQIWWMPYLNDGANPPNRFTWTFKTLIPSTALCFVWAYYPPPPSGHSGDTAHYLINDGTDTSAPSRASPTLDPNDYKGTWHGLGTYPFSSGRVSVTLDNSGTDTNPMHGVIAGPVHVTCYEPSPSG